MPLAVIDLLCKAVRESDVDEVKKYLAVGVDVNQKNTYHNSYPHDYLSVVKNEDTALEILELLLPYKPNFLLRNSGYSLYDLLKKRWHKVFAKVLRYTGKNIDLLQVNFKGKSGADIPFIFYIIQYGSKKDVQIFIKCLQEKSINPELVFQKKYKGMDPFVFSIYCKKPDVMIFFLDIEVSPQLINDDGTSALQHLVYCNRLSATERFLQVYPAVDHIDQWGECCLHDIARANAGEIFDLVLQKIPRRFFNLRNSKGETPLFVAFWENSLEVAKQLLLLWVDSSIVNNNGESVLSFSERKEDGSSSSVMEDYILKQRKFFVLREKVLSILSGEEFEDFRELFGQYICYKLRLEIGDIDVVEGSDEVESSDESEGVSAVSSETSNKGDSGEEANPKVIENELKKCLDKLKNTEFINYDLVQVYEICMRLIADDDNFKIKIESRNPSEQIGEDKENYFYTFLNGRVYQLTKILDEDKKPNAPPLNYLITTLVYEAMRHDWDDPICKLHRDLIAKIRPEYKNFTLTQFKREIEKIEAKEKSFFGENISDDSDSDKEAKYQTIPQRQKHLRAGYAQTLFKRAQPEKLFTTDEDHLNSRYMPEYDRAERRKIIRAEVDIDVQNDLKRLNALALQGKLDEIGAIATKFYVAQYRGVAYRLDEWNKPSRKQHRDAREENSPLFSRAVIAKSGYSTYSKFFNRNELGAEAKVSDTAQKLHDQLLRLKSSGPVKVNLIGEDEYLYDSALLALQDLYTKGYKKFHAFLKVVSDRFLNEENPIQVDKLEDAIALSIGAYNPFVSTGDVPDHALRYAYGEKYYDDDQKEKRLRPRWRRNGKPERPYSGKVYISLHDPLELLNESNHVSSLDNDGAVHVNLRIIPEKETSFFAFIPEGKVVSQHVAKFPSFHGKYKQIYLEKYGLTEDLYDEFRDAITQHAPHSVKAKHYKRLLTQHLISYQEVCLIEEAKIAAENKGGVLIYRDEFGGFSLLPSRGSDASATASKKRKSAALETKDLLMNKRTNRKEAEVPASSFLPSLVSHFSIFSYRNPEDSLVKSLSLLLEVDVVKMQSLRAIKPDDNEFLKAVTKQYKAKIILHEADAGISRFSIFPYRSSVDSLDRILSLLLKADAGQIQSLRPKKPDGNEFLKAVMEKYKVKIILHEAGVDEEIKEIDVEDSEREINLYYMGGGQYAALRPKHVVPNPLPPESQDDDNDTLQLDVS